MGIIIPVSIRKLKPTQLTLDEISLRRILRKRQQVTPLVYGINGEYLIVDGHNRVAIKLSQGEKQIEVYCSENEEDVLSEELFPSELKDAVLETNQVLKTRSRAEIENTRKELRKRRLERVDDLYGYEHLKLLNRVYVFA